MPQAMGRTSGIEVREDDAALSWPALLVSFGINVLAWGGLVLVYQRASRGSDDATSPRTPIVWLQPAMPRSSLALNASPKPRIRVVKVSTPPSKRPAATSTRLVGIDIDNRPPTQVQGDDDWQAVVGPVVSGSENEQTTTFTADPLQLRRLKPFPPAIARLKIRLRNVGGLAWTAQQKTCGALLTQWEGLRMDSAREHVPFGLQQPAGRDAVWRTLQAEGCLD